MGSISRKTVAWAAGAVLAVGGCTAGIVIAVHGEGTSRSATAAAHSAARPVPLRLVSISPADGAQAVDGAATVTVTYNQPLPATAPLPTLSPAIAGSWQRTGDAVIFEPATGFPSGTRVTVTVGIPGTAAPVRKPLLSKPATSARCGSRRSSRNSATCR